MSLYTKKGDDGTTSLFGSKKRISKTSAITEALGTLDELNSTVGLCRALYFDTNIAVGDRQACDILQEVQHHLFTIQGELAGADTRVTQASVDLLGDITDAIEQELAPINSFLLPGADTLSATVDIARTVARRAERRVVEVSSDGSREVSGETLAYLNRLSSLLYALVRLTNDQHGKQEQAPEYER